MRILLGSLVHNDGEETGEYLYQRHTRSLVVKQAEQARPSRAEQSRQRPGEAERDICRPHHTPPTGHSTRHFAQDPGACSLPP